MNHETSKATLQATESALVGGRYRIEAALGQGGMATVHRVYDHATSRTVALKRLRVPLGTVVRKESIEPFEREYLALVQLAHPRIVEAYDYGIESGVPYYTMELLDGGDLQGLAPIDHQRVCTWGRDICSALSLVHSRRLVYRDLSPRNVRCTSDGLAKLIDFGALVAMGPSRELVGTLPCVAPEAVQQQPLDARTDLYSLGATLYYMLAKRHAYPAHDLTQLRDLWRSRLRRPSELVPSIPEALDHLIVDLLSLDPGVRPASAAEAMQRLSAIGGLSVSEALIVPQSYLATPMLVGRSAEQATVRTLMLRATEQRGMSLLIGGPSGVGHSRFLDACVLEAKLAGLLVLRSDSTDAHAGEYGVVCTLLRQLLRANQVLALASAEPYLPLLGHALPELLESKPDLVLEPLDDAAQRQRRLQPALSNWLLDAARRQPLMLAVDDAHRIDDASAGLLALLAQKVESTGMVLAASACSDESASAQVHGALELLGSVSTNLELAPLSLELTERLLGSVFGGAANTPLIAQYIHRIADGLPRDIMRLAQHLVGDGTIRYLAGSWSLPDRLGSAQLPASMADALVARVNKLSRSALQLAVALACEPGLPFTFEECEELANVGRAQARHALDELIEGELVTSAGERYLLTQNAWTGPLLGAVSALDEASAHLRLATVLERRGSEGFRAARHLLAADEGPRGLDRLLQFARASKELTDTSPKAFFELIAGLPPDWLDTFDRGLALCERYGRPAADADALLARATGLVSHSVSDRDGYPFIERRIERLSKDTGLDDFFALPESLEPATRLRTALASAAARYEQSSEHERIRDVSGSMGQLAHAYLVAFGTIATTGDHDAWRRLRSLAPLGRVTPIMAVLEQLRLGLGARISGRSEQAIRVYELILERLSMPDRSGLPTTHYLTTYLRVNLSIATLEAALGRANCLERAKVIEQEPNYEPQAALIRHLYYLWQGDSRAAASCRQQLEILRCQTDAHHGFEGQHLLSELCAHALSDDLTGVQRALDAVEPRARIHQPWVPVLYFGRGEYHRIRGDHLAALADLEQALRLMETQNHQIWAFAAGAHLRVLLELGRIDEVRTNGRSYLRTAEDRDLGSGHNYVRMPLSLALAKAGEHEQAVVLADAVIQELIGLGATGLTLAAAYETRARIDLEMDNQEGFQRHAALFAQQWRSGEKRLTGARYRRFSLSNEALSTEPSAPTSLLSQFGVSLASCENAQARAMCGIDYLVRQSGAISGLLYYRAGSDLTLAATTGPVESDARLHDWARDYVRREELDDEQTAVHSDPASETLLPRTHVTDLEVGLEQRYVPVLVTHQGERGPAIVGLAVLLTRTDMPFLYPSLVAAELSRRVAAAGDVDLGARE